MNVPGAFTYTPAAGPVLGVGRRLIKIGSEQMRVTTVNGTALSVTRGVNGTTAASHSLNDEIYVVNCQPNYAIEFPVGSRKFLVIALELFPRPAAITWAGNLMNAHADSEVSSSRMDS